MSERQKKLNDLLRDEVGRILLEELDSGGAIVTVTGADISPTLEHATIKISVYPENKSSEIMKTISRQIYEIQQLLNGRLIMHPVPKIRFEIDKTEERADHIEELLQKE